MFVPHSNVNLHGMSDEKREDQEIVRFIREARFANGLFCPRCNGLHVVRNGTFSGRQRYLCRECKRSFSDLTGTPAAYSKRLAKWLHYIQCMLESLTLRRAAARVGIHLTTSFRLRHRLAGDLARRPPEALQGWVEIEQLWFAFSRKGERGIKEPRRRGIRDRQLTHQRPIRVVFADDRLGHSAQAVLRAPLSAQKFDEAFANAMVSCVGIVAGFGLLPVAGAMGKKKHVPVADGRFGMLKPPSGLARNTLAARKHAMLFVDWLDPFCGVATKYLPNYVAWHNTMDAQRRHRFEAVLLRFARQPATKQPV